MMGRFFETLCHVVLGFLQNVIILVWLLIQIRPLNIYITVPLAIILFMTKFNRYISSLFQVYYARMNSSFTDYISEFNFVFNPKNLESIRFCGFTELFLGKLNTAKQKISRAIRSELYRNVVSATFNAPFAPYLVIISLAICKLISTGGDNIPVDYIFFLLKMVALFIHNNKLIIYQFGYFKEELNRIGKLQAFLEAEEIQCDIGSFDDSQEN